MEPLESDTPFTLSLIAALASVRKFDDYLAAPYHSDDRGKRSAMATLRNQVRQAVASLERAIPASRRIG